MTSYSLALREIDTVQDEDTGLPDGGYVPNALEVMLRKRHLDMLNEPLLTTLLQHKWEAFARTQVRPGCGCRRRCACNIPRPRLIVLQLEHLLSDCAPRQAAG